MQRPSPTSIMFADQYAVISNLLFLKQKGSPMATEGSTRTKSGTQGRGARTGCSGYLMGGKGHGFIAALEHGFEGRAAKNLERISRGTCRSSAEAILLVEVEGADPRGSSAGRPAVGNSLPSVGDSPRTKRPLGENR